jgi:integrase
MTKRYALNDLTIRGSKAKNAPKLVYTLTDGAGLYIEANHASATPYQWRMQFKSPVTGARSRLSFGPYPATGIAEARAQAAAARALIEAGKCPAIERDKERAELKTRNAAHVAAQERARLGLAPVNSFKDIALQVIEKRRAALAPSYVAEMENTLQKYAYPAFGDLFIGEVTVDHIHALDQMLTAAGKMQMLKKLRRFCRHVFAHAIKPPLKLIQVNPVYEDIDLFATTFKTPRVAVVKSADIRELMVDIKLWNRRNGGPDSVKCALRLAALTMQRPNNIRAAEKADFNLDAGVWVIPGAKMKGRTVRKLAGVAKDHTVFLATQTVEMLRAQFAAFPESSFVFPSVTKPGQPINRDAMGAALNRLGYKGKHCAHGFRAMGRTAGQDVLKLSPIVLERALSHKKATSLDGLSLDINGGLGDSYDRTEALDERAVAAQAWADYLDTLTLPKLALAA